MKTLQVIPLIRIFDTQKAKEFYIDWLEFKIDWEHRFEEDLPLYMQISRDGIVLHLTEHHGDCTPGSKVFIECEGLKQFHQLLKREKYKYNRPGLEIAPWNALTMEVVDPFGNKLLFSDRASSNESEGVP